MDSYEKNVRRTKDIFLPFLLPNELQTKEYDD